MAIPKGAEQEKVTIVPTREKSILERGRTGLLELAHAGITFYAPGDILDKQGVEGILVDAAGTNAQFIGVEEIDLVMTDPKTSSVTIARKTSPGVTYGLDRNSLRDFSFISQSPFRP